VCPFTAIGPAHALDVPMISVESPLPTTLRGWTAPTHASTQRPPPIERT
jgi:hypothetical protein